MLHIYTSKHSTCAAIGVMLSIVFSSVIVTAAGQIMTGEQCRQYCLANSASHAMSQPSAYEMPSCCSSTPAFDTHTCHMDTMTEHVAGMFEYPVPPIVRQHSLSIIACDTAVAAQINVPVFEQHVVRQSFLHTPIPPYIQNLSLRR